MLDPGAGGWESMPVENDWINDFFFPNPATPWLTPFQARTTSSAVGALRPNFDFVGPIAAGVRLPTVGVFSGAGGEGESVEADTSDRPLVPDIWENETIFSPPVIPSGPPMSDADWERVYDEFVILNPEPQIVDWGDWFADTAQGVIGGWLNPAPAQGISGTGLVGGSAGGAYMPGPTPGAPGSAVMAGGGGCCPSPATGGPRYGRYCYATGTVTPIRRKRRKALLTNGDFNDLMRIASLPNKETVKIALAAAIR